MAQFKVRVGASTDDCLVYEAGAGHPPWDSIDLTTAAGCGAGFLASYGNLYIGCGMRFLNVTVPADSTIDSAYLNITAVATNGQNTVNTNIQGEDVDDAATFSTAANFNGRTRTTALIAWDGIAGWTQNTVYVSPDIKTIIQEIIDRPGWASGQDIVIFWEDDGSTASGDPVRLGYSWNGSAANANELEINYTEAAGGVTVRKGGISGLMSEMLNSKILFSIANPYALKV